MYSGIIAQNVSVGKEDIIWIATLYAQYITLSWPSYVKYLNIQCYCAMVNIHLIFNKWFSNNGRGASIAAQNAYCEHIICYRRKAIVRTLLSMYVKSECVECKCVLLRMEIISPHARMCV